MKGNELLSPTIVLPAMAREDALAWNVIWRHYDTMSYDGYDDFKQEPETLNRHPPGDDPGAARRCSCSRFRV